MPGARVNLPFSFGIGDTVPSNVPQELRGFFSEIYAAINQTQYVFHAHLGIGQQLQTLWSQLSYLDTLHKASMTRFYAKASENIPYGNAINLHVVSGVINVRLANATNNTKPCHGFCTTVGGITSGQYGEVILMQGLLTDVSGLTQGSRYFLSTTNGLITVTAPVAAGNIEQALGIALDSTALLFSMDFEWISH